MIKYLDNNTEIQDTSIIKRQLFPDGLSRTVYNIEIKDGEGNF